MERVNSSEAVMLSPVSVCLSVNWITQTTDQLFMKFYGMVGHNPGTSRLDLE